MGYLYSYHPWLFLLREFSMISRDDFFEAHQTMMKLSPKDALDFVVDHPCSRKLTQSFPEESFYFFITSIGINEAGSIIALGSEKQWEYLLDIEIWDKESLDYLSFTNLLTLMMSADSRKFTTWFFYKKKHFIRLYLFRNVNITVLDDDESYSDLDDNFFTNDGVFYINPINYNTRTEHGCKFLEKRNMMIREMLLRFSNIDHVEYQDLLMEVTNVIPAELEEELLRLRNVRLAEKGFLPFYEAVGIYQPIKLKDIEKRGMKILKTGKDHRCACHTIPYFPADMSRRENLFSKALKSIHDDTILQKLKIELGTLCNLVIAADNKKISSYQDLEDIVSKVSGFLNIGTELMISHPIQQHMVIPSDVIKDWGFNDIFRLGYSQVFSLNKRVKDWYNSSWFSSQKLKLHFWGEYWFGILGGVLLNKPMLFDKSNLTYRNFREYSEIYEIEKIIDQIIAVDSMFDQFNLDLSPFTSKYTIDMNNLLLSMWFLYVTGLNKEKNVYFSPIPFESFRLFYDDLWEGLDGERQIKNTKKSEFHAWVAGKMNLKISDLPEELVLFFNKLFQKLKEELSGVSFKDLDPRYINLFIIDISDCSQQ